MDDMKRMIEKYKQELMEYSRAAAPKEKLEFPEMVNEEAENATDSTYPAAPNTDPARDIAAKEESSESISKNAAPRADSDTSAEEYSSPAAADSERYSDISDFPYFTTGVPDYDDMDNLDNLDSLDNLDNLNSMESRDNTGGTDGEDITDSGVDNSDNGDSAVSENSGDDMSDAPSPIPAEEPRRPEIIGYVAPGNGDLNQIISSLVPDSSADNERAEVPSEEKTDEADEAGGQRSSKPLYEEISSQREVSDKNTDESASENNYPITDEIPGVTDNTSANSTPDYVETQSVSPERAEGLNRQPISGTNPDEQLTGRNFDDETLPANSRDDIKPLNNGTPQVFNEPSYDSYEDFVKNNPAAGTLRFRVYTARQALPVKGAVCEITKVIGGRRQTLYSLVTDESGQTEIVSLPAPPKILSQTPDSEVPVYSRFDATVKADGYEGVTFENIPVFDGVLSVQRVAMIPSAGNGAGEVIEESVSSVGGGD